MLKHRHNNNELSIVQLEEKHIDRFIETMNRIVGEKQYLSMDTPPPKEKAISYLRHVIEKDFTFYILMQQEKLIGWCDIVPKPQPYFAHGGVLAIGILKEYRGRGYGEMILRKAIATAFEKGLKRIELMTYTDNKPAIHLYKKLGFKTEGELKNDAKIDGQYKNSYLMALLNVS